MPNRVSEKPPSGAEVPMPTCPRCRCIPCICHDKHARVSAGGEPEGPGDDGEGAASLGAAAPPASCGPTILA